MKYRLTIEEFAPNQNYAEELKRWNEDNRYRQFGESTGPQPETVFKVLSVEVDEDDFQVIKQAAVATMGNKRVSDVQLVTDTTTNAFKVSV